MLFVLDKSLDAILDDELHPQFNRLLEELSVLAKARRNKKLMVFLESDVFYERLKLIASFNKSSLSVYSVLNRTRAFKSSLLKKLKNIIRITASGGKVETRKINENIEIIIPINMIPDNIFNSPILLAENIMDAKAYIIFAKIAAAANADNMAKVGLQGELRGGGGSAIAVEYFEIKNKKERLALCILDSDVRYPTCPPNDWSQAIVNDDLKNPIPFIKSNTIEVYSIENLFPLSCLPNLSHYVSDLQAAHALKNDLPILSKHASEEYWRYIRLKNGVSCSDFRDNAALGEYWLGNVEKFSNYSSKKCETLPGKCKHSCNKIPIYRSDTLKEFVAKYEETNDEELRELHSSIPYYILENFNELAKLITAWMCCGTPMAISA